MPRIIIAKTAGFCWGVSRAIDLVMKAAEAGNTPIYTDGALIHNPQVLSLLESSDIHVSSNIESIDHGTIAIRAHGITPQRRQLLKSKGLKIVDATCPHVGGIQAIVKQHATKGYTIIIIGETGHPEVIGLMGFTQGRGFLIDKDEDLDNLPPLDGEKICIVAQSTQSRSRLYEVTERIRSLYPQAIVFDTLCDVTSDRQNEVLEMTKQVDLMIVVGGKNSGNTQRMAELSRKAGVTTYHIETEEELTAEMLQGHEVIGLTAGASTPDWMIKRVQARLQELLPQPVSV
ncbi:MAG: 4-hydroxy-3-methylbut-2-enyl diphosphate reductase [Acidobacteriota bacterium]|nr:4-hydroxy-3-methylbut-2-enyl diphosphate reductase [Blastocatellia bacterium]MDW8413293.1 4-hydroxy-3-methylbut-2-enyl diphosphate reductase [Acidobacteriota bacterium]